MNKYRPDENAPLNTEQDKAKVQNQEKTGPGINTGYEEAEKEWNSKILKITLKINEQYPELSKYLEEMPVTIPADKNPEITLEKLRNYYESLNALLTKFIKESP